MGLGYVTLFVVKLIPFNRLNGHGAPDLFIKTVVLIS